MILSKSNKNLKATILFIALLVLMLIGTKIFNSNINQEIENSKRTTVAKVYRIDLGAKNVSIKYKFIFNNKTYYHGLPVDDFPYRTLVGNFYKVEFAGKSPKFSRILLENEITDTLAINAAGFDIVK